MFTGNDHRATWGNCEPIRGDFLFFFFVFFCFVLFFDKVMLDLWNLRDLHAVDTELHSTVTGSESVIGSDMCFFFLFHFFLSRLPPAFSSRNTTSQEVKAQRQRVWHFLM